MRIILLAAQSADGFITQHAIPGSGFTSPEDKLHFTQALAACDCSVMGGETYRSARNFVLSQITSSRLTLVMTRRPADYAGDAVPAFLEFTSSPPTEIAAALRKRGLKRCALLGGSQIYSLFLEAKLVDEIWLTIEPRLFGGGTPFLTRTTDERLELLSSDKLGLNTLLLKYRVVKK